MHDTLKPFLELEAGYYKVSYNHRTYGMSVHISADGRRRKLYAEELGGRDHVSCNLYVLEGQELRLKPCEMPAQKVIDFIDGFCMLDPQPDI